MSRRTAGRPPASVFAVPIRDLPDFVPTDHATPPADGWTAETLWAAAWSYADQNADGHPPTALNAFKTAARRYDAARGISARSMPSVARQDLIARLNGTDYARRRHHAP
ncbi:hypothetical protein Are01nite_32660 [Actinoplanes regularis]|nr:hypothetical protein Are01nite_32660 [Actinoplanes regularis]